MASARQPSAPRSPPCRTTSRRLSKDLTRCFSTTRPTTGMGTQAARPVTRRKNSVNEAGAQGGVMKGRQERGWHADRGIYTVSSSFYTAATALPHTRLRWRTGKAWHRENSRGRHPWASVWTHGGIFHLCYVLFIPPRTWRLLCSIHFAPPPPCILWDWDAASSQQTTLCPCAWVYVCVSVRLCLSSHRKKKSIVGLEILFFFFAAAFYLWNWPVWLFNKSTMRDAVNLCVYILIYNYLNCLNRYTRYFGVDLFICDLTVVSQWGGSGEDSFSVFLFL